MSTKELEQEWLVHQRSLAETLPRLSERARRAESTEGHTLASWRYELTGALGAVAAALRAHVAADEHPGGFLAAGERRAPRLIHALEGLRAEHHDLIGAVAGAELLVGQTSVDEAVPATVAAVDAVLDRVQHHLDTANRLAMDIANDDLGDGD